MTELLVAWVAFPAIQLVLWLGCGSLVARFIPGDLPRSLLAPLGFGVVVVVGGFTTAIPALAEATTPAVVLLAAVGLVTTRPWAGRRPSPWLAGALAAAWAVYAAPVVLSGSATFAGYIRLDDTATWLALTDAVTESGRSLDGLASSSYEATLAFNLADGYPVGAFIPLGVGHVLTGLDSAWLIQPYMALLAVLLALALWELSGRLLSSARARTIVVAVAAQPALLYGYFLWGGVKELAAAALIALAACLVVRAASAESRFGGLMPAAIVIAALVGCLSLAGVAWVGPLLLGALALALATDRRPRVMARAAAFAALFAVMVAPVLFGGALVPPTSMPLDDPDARGNLIEPLSALQALGVWPTGDFRTAAHEMSVTIAICAFALAAAIGACAVSVKARRWDLAAYLVGVPAAALAIALIGSPWVEAKAFAIVSPGLLFGALLGCAWAWSERRLILGVGVGAIVIGGVAWSNALAYHKVNLAPRDQLAELEELGEMTSGDGPLLMTEYQPYGVRHFMRGSDPEGASELRRRLVPLTDGTSLPKGEWADTDDFRADAFEPYEALVLRRSPEQSMPPGNYVRRWAGDYYELWTRADGAPVATERLALGDGRLTAGLPRCAEVRELAETIPGGTLRAAPAAETLFTHSAVVDDDRASAQVEVEGGRYSVWLDGSTRTEAELFVDGNPEAKRAPQLNNVGLYTELGVVELEPGPHTVTVELEGPGLSPGSGAPSDLGGRIAIGPPPGTEARLTSVAAGEWKDLCGQPWDWIEASPRRE